MKKSEALDRVRAVCRTRHFAWATEQAYCQQVARFFEFCAAHRDLASMEARVRGWLEAMAPHCAAKTQAQALNAVVFFFKQVLEKPLGELGQWSKARIPRRLPVWLSPDEMRRLLALADGTRGLMLELYYGCGLRLMEGVRLRTGDLDLGQRLLTVRGAKRDKDRTVPIPLSLVPRLAAHLQRVRALWEADALRGLPPVALPAGLDRKYPNAGREWVWFWVFPSAVLSADPRTGVVRRHHAHEDAMIKALKRLVARAAIAKRVTMHALRHSFATHLLMAGVPIHTLAKLLGHESIETTEIYLHVLPREVTASPSPLDLLRGQSTIVPLVALPGGRAALSA